MCKLSAQLHSDFGKAPMSNNPLSPNPSRPAGREGSLNSRFDRVRRIRSYSRDAAGLLWSAESFGAAVVVGSYRVGVPTLAAARASGSAPTRLRSPRPLA